MARVTAPADWLLGSPRVRRFLAVQTGLVLASGVAGALALHRPASLAPEPLALVSALPRVAQAEALAAEPPAPPPSPPPTAAAVSRSSPRPRPRPRPTTTTVKARPPTTAKARPVNHPWTYWAPRIRRCESNNDYRARNPDTGASGAYQVLDTTWGGRFGVTHAGDATPAQQDEGASQLYRTFGLRPWAESARCWR
jgi:transglycosylase-like protein